nr:DUF2020 domain-containing protein [Corynebacterium diphtheriae]
MNVHYCLLRRWACPVLLSLVLPRQLAPTKRRHPCPRRSRGGARFRAFRRPPMPPQGRDGFEVPYLDSQWVDTNGQRMTGQGVDTRFDTPACVFWSYPEAPQATVMVRHMTSEEEAIRVVDWAAPIDTTEPAEEPEGWSGGRAGHEEGAVYAVQKGPVAVVVWSNQQQSLKAELMAKEAIARLGL